ncbi:transposase [Burkholderia ubonensis]|uniref:transposase n=1 Tax=Burkholderia ubonensis TaxID=101571 RepID=UPI0039F4B89F
MTGRVQDRSCGRVTQTVEIPPKRQTRRHPTQWKRTIVAQTFEPDASVARVARENNRMQ